MHRWDIRVRILIFQGVSAIEQNLLGVAGEGARVPVYSFEHVYYMTPGNAGDLARPAYTSTRSCVRGGKEKFSSW